MRKFTSKKNAVLGSTLDSLLEDDGLLGEATACAVKRVIAWQVQQAMEKDAISKTEMAHRMGTSRPALDRLLDPANDAVTLKTIDKAAAAVGKRLQIALVDAR